MAKTERSTPAGRRGLSRFAAAALARPAATGGGLVTGAMAIAILVNALALQSGPHPAPLFKGTRPVPAAEVDVAPAARTAAPDADSIDDIIARTTGRQAPAVDSGLVADIQRELKARGFYDGDVDGLTGPMTSAAIVRFEEQQGLAVTGEPTGDVLAALRRGRPATSLDTGEQDAAPQAPPPRARPMAAAGAPPPAAAPAVGEATATIRAEPAVVRTETTASLRQPDQAAPTDPRLARIQEALDLLGYGPLRPDGRWTASTRDAIRRFEENRGLPITGEIGERFVSELVRIGGLSLD